MKSAPITPSFIGIATDILKWGTDFLVPVHEKMLRPTGAGGATPGPVCPFVAPSIDADLFQFVFHPEINGQSEEDIADLLYRYVDYFKSIPPFNPKGQLLKVLNVVFPNIPPDEHAILSRAARRAKTTFVTNQQMLAAFYPACTDPSIHNPALKTSKAPHPFIAVRQMALHDIFFVADEKQWFDEYNRHFGHRFRDPSDLETFEQPLLRKYNEAKQRYIDV